ncbi:MAG: WecB/TagA/CpsF family glycosyltransferase [Oscillatoriales cyanobacterium RM2_1_1]|nr:WecB/TagA/CpsF family glycosyltransferase [Oscillatoriales cyanobacterium RM2_1_1]
MITGESTAPKFSVLGLPVSLLEDYPGWLMSHLQQGLGAHVITLNAEMVMQAQQCPELSEAIHQAEMIIPDGSGVVLYLRFKGKKIQRCPGIDLAESLVLQVGQSSESDGILFYGGQPGVSQQAAERFTQAVPNLAIASYHGYLSVAEEQSFQEYLKTHQPRLILVGLGVPRQELWILKNRHLCPNSIWVGVGGSFDIWAGTKKRAPTWFCDNHLEWLYRLYQEPWRWRRMLALPQFAWKALMG